MRLSWSDVRSCMLGWCFLFVVGLGSILLLVGGSVSRSGFAVWSCGRSDGIVLWCVLAMCALSK